MCLTLKWLTPFFSADFLKFVCFFSYLILLNGCDLSSFFYFNYKTDMYHININGWKQTIEQDPYGLVYSQKYDMLEAFN